jgi:DUF1365 family protein
VRQSCLYEGSVRHRRMGTVKDEFRYPLFMAYIDLDELPHLFDGRWLWSARRPAVAWFRRADYFGDPSVPLADAVRELVRERTGVQAQGPIRLLTHLRYFGKCFNPVSFYYCFDEPGERVVAVVADVTNTPWGERHAYVMAVADPVSPPDPADPPDPGGPAQPADPVPDHGTVTVVRARVDKQLHVSPLLGMNSTYDWRMTEPGERLSVHIESDDRARGRKTFDATLSLRRRELTPHSLRAVLARYPLITLRIVTRIYAHALRLRLRGARYHPHPEKGVLA